MKRSLFFFTSLLMLLSISLTAATKRQFQPLTKDQNKAKIIFQTAMKTLKVDGETHFIRYYISQINKNKFSYGVATYTCKSKKICTPSKYDHIVFYTSCEGFDQLEKPACNNRQTEKRDHHLDQRSQYPQDEGSWYKCDDFDSNCSRNDYLYEEPSRYSDSDVDGIDSYPGF